MVIKSAEFLVSSARVDQCPKSDIPEYAFIGRSNVGKSSLINMLSGRNGLAKTSSTPGKTMLINHFLVNGAKKDIIREGGNGSAWFIVDLPGYGYAKRNKKDQDKLQEMISQYIIYREQMTLLFVLIDSRLEPQKIDLEFIEWLGENEIPFAIVFTKGDKLSVSKLKSNVLAYLKKLGEQWEELPPHFITSSESKLGREELLEYIEEINKSVLNS